MRSLAGSFRLRPSGSGAVVAIAVLAAVTALLIIGLRGDPPPRTHDQLVHQVASGLRCPVCHDLSAADSPAPIARQMRAQISQKLTEGETPAEIRDGFVAAYGTSVLMAPPREGIASVAYSFPLVALGVAALAAALLLRRLLRRPTSDDADPARMEER